MEVKRARVFTIQGEIYGYSPAMVGLLIFYSLLSISPLWNSLGIQSRHLLVFTLISVAFISYVNGRPLRTWVFPVSLVLFGCAFGAGVYWAEPRLILYPMFLLAACVLLAQSTERELSTYVTIASWILLILLIGGLIGFFIAQMGVEPALEFANPDGRSNYFFYTTLTNSYWGNWIQPSGIYDEPGAFSFMICAVAFMRFIIGKDYKLTWVLLILGFITFSLAHLVFVGVFALAERISFKRVTFVIVSLLAFATMAIVSGVAVDFQRFLFARVTFDAANERGFSGRIGLAQNALEGLNSESHAAWVGIHSDCTVDYVKCRERWEYMGENPFAPLVLHGIILSWPYYLYLIFGVLFLFKGRRNFAFLAVTLLFLQRPYILSFGYSFAAVLPLWLQKYSGRPQRVGNSKL